MAIARTAPHPPRVNRQSGSFSGGFKIPTIISLLRGILIGSVGILIKQNSSAVQKQILIMMMKLYEYDNYKDGILQKCHLSNKL